jgi:hypothetical protein
MLFSKHCIHTRCQLHCSWSLHFADSTVYHTMYYSGCIWKINLSRRTHNSNLKHSHIARYIISHAATEIQIKSYKSRTPPFILIKKTSSTHKWRRIQSPSRHTFVTVLAGSTLHHYFCNHVIKAYTKQVMKAPPITKQTLSYEFFTRWNVIPKCDYSNGWQSFTEGLSLSALLCSIQFAWNILTPCNVIPKKNALDNSKLFNNRTQVMSNKRQQRTPNGQIWPQQHNSIPLQQCSTYLSHVLLHLLLPI